MTLQTDIIDTLNTKLRTVTGISFVPDEPVDQIPQSIFGLVIPSGINWKSAPAPSYRAYFDITIYVGMVRGSLHNTIPILLPFAESVPTAIEEWICAQEINVEEKTGTFGGYDWGGVDYLGWIFQLNNVKEMVTP